MKILLDAYFDNNFGDDLFVDILLNRYPNDQFFVFWQWVTERVLQRAERFPNLVIFPGDCAYQEKMNFDAYIMIGGDVLPNGMNYKNRINAMKHVKECGGYVAMLGFSLYEKYEEQTINDLEIMTGLADSIVIRDHASVCRLKEMIPGVHVTESTDMVFAALQKRSVVQRDILGIIPRRKLYSTDEEYENYCKSMAKIADAYLELDDSRKVRFLAFSTGEYDDRVASKDIIARMKHQNDVEMKAYEEDIESFYLEIAECRAMLPTRFHGTLISVLQEIPFVPVTYEVKVTQLLDELGYEGIRIPYGVEIADDEAEQIITEIENWNIPDNKYADYQGKRELFFGKTDDWRNNCKVVEKPLFYESKCQIRTEYERLVRENKALKLQQQELEKWIDLLQQQKKEVEEQNVELENIRQKMMNGSDGNAEQIKELEKWVESLKEERARFEKQNLMLEEIRKWQYEKLMRGMIRRKKHDIEYQNFIKELEGKYK